MDPETGTFHVALNYRFGGHAQPATFTAPIHNWTGLYVGAGVGAGALVHKLTTDFIPGLGFTGLGGEGLLAEATVGYDHELSNNFVVGMTSTSIAGPFKSLMCLRRPRRGVA